MNAKDRSSSSFSIATFSALGLAFIAFKKWEQRRRRCRDVRDGLLADGNASGSINNYISVRGQALLTPTQPYIMDYLKCLQDQCDPHSNPQGYIPLCVAENKLIIEHFASRLMQVETAYRAFSESIVYCYNNSLGLPGTREAVAYFLTKHFLFPEERNLSFQEALHWIRPEYIAIGSGAASLVSHLAMSLADPGDAVLIPAPYYAAFDADVKIFAGCVTIPVHSADPTIGPSAKDLESAAVLAEAKGLRVRILLITNPNNPLGTIYPPTVIKSAIDWARSRSMHTIVDEVYALGCHEELGSGFESVVRILKNDLGNDVHHLWALSKDFGASGFRIGTLYTQNNHLLSSLANLNIFTSVSHPMQMILSEVLTDDNFIYQFLDNAREKIRYSYYFCTKRLDEMVIPYVNAKAGIFVYADFSALLPSQTPEGEAQFASLLLDAAHIIMTPGQSQKDLKPGMFRICYCFVSLDVLEIAMNRLDRLVGKIRRWHWDNLNSDSLTDIL
eukprot:CCRYP_006231-RA/>CCRYP_006231-RA protein AED:0.34 eAED:0.34 QI:66/1/1/1/0.6/0.5/6/2038/501